MTRVTRIGTSHFSSFTAAVNYYSAQGFNAADVQAKRNTGEITIGAPSLIKPNESIEVDIVCGRIKLIEKGFNTCKGCTTESDRAKQQPTQPTAQGLDRYPEFRWLVNEVAANTLYAIIDKADGIESTMPYKKQFVLEEVIALLKKSV